MTAAEHQRLMEAVWALPDSEASELLDHLLNTLYDNYAVTECCKEWMMLRQTHLEQGRKAQHEKARVK